MKVVGILSVLLTGFLLMYAVTDFPEWGDPQSPANSYLSTHYITESMAEAATPNMVTTVLADYRGFDTMLETTVVLVAGIGIIAVLRRRRDESEGEEHRDEVRPLEGVEHDLIIRTTCRLLLPMIQIFALYVIFHGHHSPGGGFQGGVILAASLIMAALSFSLRGTLKKFTERAAIVMGGGGVLLYAGVGLTAMALGGNFLEYGVLHRVFGTSEAMAHSHGILLVEIGVGLTVMSVLFLIYANLSSRGDCEEGL